LPAVSRSSLAHNVFKNLVVEGFVSSITEICGKFFFTTFMDNSYKTVPGTTAGNVSHPQFATHLEITKFFVVPLFLPISICLCVCYKICFSGIVMSYCHIQLANYTGLFNATVMKICYDD
jgi:hypothetical protein